MTEKKNDNGYCTFLISSDRAESFYGEKSLDEAKRLYICGVTDRPCVASVAYPLDIDGYSAEINRGMLKRCPLWNGPLDVGLRLFELRRKVSTEEQNALLEARLEIFKKRST